MYDEADVATYYLYWGTFMYNEDVLNFRASSF